MRLLAATAFALLLAAAPAQASFRDSCETHEKHTVCTGMVESFDDTPLSTTLTLPAGVKKGERLPLIVFLHGFLSNKGEYISETEEAADNYKTVEFNNLWFASRGYAVLNYDARGHGDSEGQIALASKEFEIRDTQHLTGLLVDDGTAKRKKVAAVGGSYGGGQTWLLATVRGEGAPQYGTWRSPKGKVVRLAAAVPQFTWTDLLFSLVPNGLDAQPTPLGVAKITLLNGFIAVIGTKMTEELASWLGRVNQGEPYDGDPLVEEAKVALTKDRSAYYQDGFFKALGRSEKRQRSIPILAAQGWTDPIFPAVEAVRMYKRLRSIRRDYPIQLYFGDFEHLTSQIKIPDMRYYHRLATRMLARYLLGKKRRVRFDVRSAPTLCDPNAFGPVLRVKNWGALHPDALEFELPGPQTTSWRVVDPRGPATDHVVLGLQRRGCVTTTQPVSPGVASWRMPVERDFTLLGMPRLELAYEATGTDIELNSRLWDVAPDGVQTLVTRAALRVVDPGSGEQKAVYDLYGNHWRLEKGHELLLEVTSDDSTFFRSNNIPSTVTINAAKLTLPGRE
ncbi:MAG: alpha/beta fold hydrolase [Thermoleophilaceae bacterium]